MWGGGFTGPNRTARCPASPCRAAKTQLHTGLTACLDFRSRARPRQSPGDRSDRSSQCHITVESGRELISGRDQMDDWAIERITPVLRQAIESGRRTPVLGGYWIQCELSEGGLAVGIGHADRGRGASHQHDRTAGTRRRAARPARPHRRSAGAAGNRRRQRTVPARR